ncbi:DUF4870 domain-containing protein [Novipirellula artificiosorum]|uniref:Chloroplast import component protein (Tic20) n=1 Tax=Novipirellula artificiosorum TaxID=2528016 RepID=A0A5C6D6T4_9BACT|nr:DUF4870 domain-containing protein [Novipirellula artificiosorum]TWU30956.1 hypothetical protein Poly41_64250 [Novipirellula artificiosorum]
MSNPFTPPESNQANDPASIDEFSTSQDDRNLALIAHLSGCAGIALGGLVGFVGPLVLYLMYKDKSPFVESQAKEALNFQITLLILSVICVVITVATCGTLFPIVFVPMVLQIVFGIVAALAVRDGKPYQYPYNLRLFQ